MENIFTQLSIIMAIALIVSSIMKLLKQPLIIGYIVTGLILGPYFLNVVSHPEELRELSKFGIALLLFIIGLSLNPRVVKDVGKASTIIGLGQVIFTASVGFGIAKLLGFENTEALYAAIALTFSSTIIILKLMSDKKETTQLHGKVAIGMLLVQDLVATVVLIVATGTQQDGISISQISTMAGFALLLGTMLYVTSRYLLPRITKFIADSQEYLFLFSIAWGFGIASLFSFAQLSVEVGALFAGVALATQPYAIEVGSRLRPLRDFFIILFFIVLGVEFEITSFSEIALPAAVFSSFVLIGNPLIVMTIMGLLGYTKKTSFKTALVVAQISEFSLIFVLLGLEAGQISQTVVSIITMVGFITIAGSTYMVLYDEKLYLLLEKYLTLFEKRKTMFEPKQKSKSADIFLFGYKRGGQEFVAEFKRLNKKYMVIDYDPEAADDMTSNKVPFAYGDMTDAEFLSEIDIESSKMVLSTVTDRTANMFITTHTREVNPRAIIIVHADSPEDAAQLYEHGATYVMVPHYIGTERITHMIRKNGLKKSDFTPSRERHLRYVQSHL